MPPSPSGLNRATSAIFAIVALRPRQAPPWAFALVFIVCAALLVAAGGVSLAAQQKLQSSQDLVTHNKTVQLAVQTLLTQMNQARANVRLFLLTAREDARASFVENRAALADGSAALQALVADDPAQQQRARVLNAAVDAAVRGYDAELAGSAPPGSAPPGRTRPFWPDVKAAAEALSAAEEARLQQSLTAQKALATAANLAVVASAALGLCLLGLVAVLTRRLTSADLHRRVASADARERLAHAALAEKARDFQLLADTISQLAWIAASDGAIYWYNKRWYEFTGIDDGSTLGWGWSQVHHPDHLDRATETFKQAIAAGRDWEDTFPLRAADGSYRWFLSRALPLRDERGEVIRWFGTNTDVTEQKLAEAARAAVERLEVENGKLREATRMKSQFLADMSHELRTPLNAIIGFSDLMQLDLVPAEASKHLLYLARIGTSARELLQLINELLDLSKIEAGRIDFFPEHLDLHGLLQEVLLSLQLSLSAKGIRVVTEIDPTLDGLFLDPLRLKQVLFNFLTNAIKFTPDCGEVTVRMTAQGPDHWRLEVQDNGIGIAAADVPKLFVEFQQLESGMTKRFQGTGLGLALTRRIVEAQGGSVGVHSAPGEGSVFFAVLGRVHGAAAGGPVPSDDGQRADGPGQTDAGQPPPRLSGR